jgi:hypothetical protein
VTGSLAAYAAKIAGRRHHASAGASGVVVATGVKRTHLGELPTDSIYAVRLWAGESSRVAPIFAPLVDGADEA